MDEPALIHSARKGDLDAFNTLVLAYQHQVYNLAYRIMGEEAAASDATQEAFISAYKHLKIVSRRFVQRAGCCAS